MRYEIQENTLRVFNDDGIDFLVQPHHPEGRPWHNSTEIEDWAKGYMANFIEVESTDTSELDAAIKAGEAPVND